MLRANSQGFHAQCRSAPAVQNITLFHDILIRVCWRDRLPVGLQRSLRDTKQGHTENLECGRLERASANLSLGQPEFKCDLQLRAVHS